MASTTSFYEVLGIPMNASCHEIKEAYRKLARVCHPDVVAMNQKATSATEFMKIHKAYSTLSDPSKRAAYDREHILGACSNWPQLSAKTVDQPYMPVSREYCGRARRTWETDQCW